MLESVGAKTALGSVAAVMAYLTGVLNELTVVLAILMIADYILGVTVGLLIDGFDKHKGIMGAVKKMGYFFLVLLAFLLDFTMGYLTGQLTGTATKGLFGYTILCYLIGTEGLSILQSLTRLGLPVPEFLRKAFVTLRNSGDDTKPQ